MRRNIIIAVAVVVIGIIVWQVFFTGQKAEEAVEIETAIVERGSLVVTASASGELEPLTTVEVKSRSGGEIKSLFVEAGDYVNSGDLIAQIDPTQLESRAESAAASLRAARANAEQASLNANLQVTRTDTSVAQAESSLDVSRATVRQREQQLQQERETSKEAVRKAELAVRTAEERLAQAKARRDAEKETHAAEVDSAEASLESSRQNLHRVTAGPRQEQIDQARASLRSAEAALANAETYMKRQKQLLDKGYISQQAYDDAVRSYEQAQASRDSAKHSLAELEAGSRPEDIAQARAQVKQSEASLRVAKTNAVQLEVLQRDVTAAEAALEEARASLSQAKSQRRNIEVLQEQLASATSQVRQSEAALKSARAGALENTVRKKEIEAAQAQVRQRELDLEDAAYDLKYTSVKSPRAGVIMQKLVEEGTVIPAGTAALREGTALVTLADVSQMYVLANVDESDIAPVQVGQKAEVNVAAMPRKALTGEVVKIYPLGQEEQNVIRFQVKIHLKNPPKSLRPGMTADATITVAERDDILKIPDVCIDRSAEGGPTVTVMTGEEQVEDRTVKIGLSNWDETEIISGLKEGDKVVIPPPPGSVLPRWMQSDNDEEAQQRRRSRMLRNFRR